ncbi:MAG: TauD/TfdA family dioxygenase [Deltaproteobacteria bacterium]|nr:TauD/TfdA family dioxygenase [Deltaproteobacteria bacterium]MBW2723595.1 TauD/TfdA family dioxygenase [Deltaproteobacteria bacterium]
MSELQIQPASNAVGAEILDVDVTDLSDSDFEQLRKAYFAHGAIFLRDQKLTPEQHIAFAERWGEININRFFGAVDGYPQIAEVRKEPDQKNNIGGGWHTDHSYDVEPAMGSILYAREVPATGGDTLFASMYAAYDALSDGLKQTLDGLRAVHSSRHVFGAGGAANRALEGRIGNPKAATQDAVHPVVIQHPDNGRKALYVNPGFTIRFDGWTGEESSPLLKFLYRHAVRPEFTYRYQWKPGSIAFWDNRATWHYALNDYHGQKRLMHRITIEGSALA